jgi:hypothetical protein
MESKKRSVGASERDEFLRAAWRALVAGEIYAERLVPERASGFALAHLSLLYGLHYLPTQIF